MSPQHTLGVRLKVGFDLEENLVKYPNTPSRALVIETLPASQKRSLWRSRGCPEHAAVPTAGTPSLQQLFASHRTSFLPTSLRKNHFSTATDVDVHNLEANVHLGNCQRRLGRHHEVSSLSLRSCLCPPYGSIVPARAVLLQLPSL